MSEQSATCGTCSSLKVIRSNIEIAVTPPRIVRFRSNSVQSLITSQPIYCWFKVKSQRSRSQRNVRYQQRKRYNTATAVQQYSNSKLIDFIFGAVSVIAERNVGRPQVAIQRYCDTSLVQLITVDVDEKHERRRVASLPLSSIVKLSLIHI